MEINILDIKSQIEHLLIDSEGVITDDIQFLIDELDKEGKSSIEFFIKKYKENNNIILDRSNRLKKLEKSIEVKKKSMEYWKDRIDFVMKKLELKSIETDQGDVSYRNNTKVNIVDETLIPDEYMRTPPIPKDEPNKIAIGAALKLGIEVPGTELDQTPILKIE